MDSLRDSSLKLKKFSNQEIRRILMYELSMDQVLCVSGGSEASAAAGAAAGESAGRAAMQTVKAVVCNVSC